MKKTTVKIILSIASFLYCVAGILAKNENSKTTNNMDETQQELEISSESNNELHYLSLSPTSNRLDKFEFETKSELVIFEVETTEEELVTEEETTVNKEEEYRSKIDSINCSDVFEWYKQYKSISDEYSSYINRETIYDRFTTEELNLLFGIVEAEVTGNTYFINKANVASVIFNRLKDDSFPNDLTSILTYPYQFSTYASGRYLNVEITEATILACEFAYEIGDTVSGALFFDSKKDNSWAYGKLTLVTIDEVGHSFYR